MLFTPAHDTFCALQLRLDYKELWEELRSIRRGDIRIVINYTEHGPTPKAVTSTVAKSGRRFVGCDLDKLLSLMPDPSHAELLQFWQKATDIREGQSEATRVAVPLRTQNWNVPSRPIHQLDNNQANDDDDDDIYGDGG